jgi:tetratricopeptide (TPR) repeat protein
MLIKRLVVVCALIPLGAVQVIAQEAFSWIGQNVVTKYKYPVKVGNQIIEDGSRHQTYTVTRAEGDWLWVVSGNIGGWLPVSQVVPIGQALDFYTNEIRSNPTNSAAYNMRGLIWNDMKEYEIALADFNEAIRLYPKDASAFTNRGNASNDKKEYDKAIADYNEAIRLDPKPALPFNNRGNAWYYKKEYDKAIADYTEAIRFDPKYASAFNNRGWAWHQKKELDNAIADYNEAIRLDSNFALAYINRGVAWEATEEYDKAIADFGEAIRINPKYALAYKNRGDTWFNKREYEKAISDYKEAIRIAPKFAGAYVNRAWLWATCFDAKFRDGQKALESATRACELSEWKGANELDTLAAAYAEIGDFDKAVEYQEKANKLRTDSEDNEKGEERLELYKDKKPYRQID